MKSFGGVTVGWGSMGFTAVGTVVTRVDIIVLTVVTGVGVGVGVGPGVPAQPDANASMRMNPMMLTATQGFMEGRWSF